MHLCMLPFLAHQIPFTLYSACSINSYYNYLCIDVMENEIFNFYFTSPYKKVEIICILMKVELDVQYLENGHFANRLWKFINVGELHEVDTTDQ